MGGRGEKGKAPRREAVKEVVQNVLFSSHNLTLDPPQSPPPTPTPRWLSERIPTPPGVQMVMFIPNFIGKTSDAR